jgi:hypothetical protein
MATPSGLRGPRTPFRKSRPRLCHFDRRLPGFSSSPARGYFRALRQDDCETRVSDKAWGDELPDYEKWT